MDTETMGGKVTGVVRDDVGNPAASASVLLIPQRFIPGNSDAENVYVQKTNDRGEFAFVGVSPDVYNLQAQTRDSAQAFFLQRISLETDTTNLELDPVQTAEMGGLQVVSPEDTENLEGRVFIRGSFFSWNVEGEVSAKLEKAPPSNGDLTLEYLPDNSKESVVLSTRHQVVPGTSVIVGIYASWNHSGRISINTTADGADVGSDVYGYPLLVRLQSSDFNFKEVGARGEDLRFSNEDGTRSLPYEIERWETGSGESEFEAVVWVRVDTIFGNNSDQFIQMFWGKELASSLSSSEDVFDTEDGFTAVWHLGEMGSNAQGAYSDATSNNLNGTGISLDETSGVDGFVGGGQYFDGYEDYIVISNDPVFAQGTGDYTLSGLFRADSLDTADQVFSHKGPMPLEIEVRLGVFGGYGGKEGNGSASAMLGTDSIDVERWYYGALVRKDGVCTVYLNGEPNAMSEECPLDVTNTTDVFLGRDGINVRRYFHGVLDEIRLSNVARTGDWLRLNQAIWKQGSRVVWVETK